MLAQPVALVAKAVPRAVPQVSDKVDLLLVIDNSRSMADKQELLKAAVPELLSMLTNPRCIDDKGMAAAQQPDLPSDPCPGGTQREFAPVDDMHIGVISSSIGGHGSDACVDGAPSENDMAHLLARSSTDNGAPPVATWNDKGFLVWDPAAKHNPPGSDNADALIFDLSTMVGGVGEVGCGFEAQLEAWYRFLVEPDPYDSIVIENDEAVLKGTDAVIKTQRADFLRPDSLLAIISLTDENDCSTRDGGQDYFVNQIYSPGTSAPYHLPKPRAACATDPSSDCCRSCGQTAGPGCDTAQDDCEGSLDNLADSVNLRCFDQKRRFGIDFLWPTDRYATGLSSAVVQDRHGNVVANPIFSDLNPNDNNSKVRNSSLVFLLTITGVPWQDIVRRDANGKPGMTSGLDGDGHPVGGSMSAGELRAKGVWDLILGDPSSYYAKAQDLPTDPLMIESIDPRSGTNPVTGDPIVGTKGSELENPINGHEYSNPIRTDLQYACIFPLAKPRDCSTNFVACDCKYADNDNPLCDPASKQMQKYAKAYPGLRHLDVVKRLGGRAVVASICPKQQTMVSASDYGYRPAMSALIAAIRPRLQE